MVLRIWRDSHPPVHVTCSQSAALAKLRSDGLDLDTVPFPVVAVPVSSGLGLNN